MNYGSLLFFVFLDFFWTHSCHPNRTLEAAAQKWKQWIRLKPGQRALEGQNGSSNLPRSANKMWESFLQVEWSVIMFSARLLATQYGELQEVVKLCKSERLSESQCCLCKYHLNHNMLKISLSCSLPSPAQSSSCSRISVHTIACQFTPTWPVCKSGHTLTAFKRNQLPH